MLLGLIARAQVFCANLRNQIMGEIGAVSTEYVLLLIFIAVVIVGTATGFGIALAKEFKEACEGAFGSCP